MHSLKYSQGFTLIELIMVIVITGILSTMTTDIITLPVKAYMDLERRTTLVDTAEMSLRRMQRDIRRALPNSINITDGGTTIELLHTTEGGRYRASVSKTGPEKKYILDFTKADSQFEVIGFLPENTTGYLVIYNTGTIGANAYADADADELPEIDYIDYNDPDNLNAIILNLDKAKLFPYRSPQQRFFIVDTPITYKCENGKLRRYDNYPISSSPTLPTGNIQAKSHRLICSFNYDEGSNTRAGLVTLSITLTDKVGESVKLIHQVHVDNMP